MLTFSRVTPDDLVIVRNLAHRIWHAHYPGMITTGQIDYMLERFFNEARLLEELNRGVIWELARLATEPGQPAIGFLSCHPPPPDAHGSTPPSDHDPTAPRWKLSKLYLSPEFHGQGLGQAMLEHVFALARQAGARAVELTVNKQNTKALRAYARAGFQKTAEAVADIGNGYVMDDYILTRRLDPT